MNKTKARSFLKKYWKYVVGLILLLIVAGWLASRAEAAETTYDGCNWTTCGDDGICTATLLYCGPAHAPAVASSGDSDMEAWATIGHESEAVGYRYGHLGVEIGQFELTYPNRCGRLVTKETHTYDALGFLNLPWGHSAVWTYQGFAGLGFYDDQVDDRHITGAAGLRAYHRSGATVGLEWHTERDLSASVGWSW